MYYIAHGLRDTHQRNPEQTCNVFTECWKLQTAFNALRCNISTINSDINTFQIAYGLGHTHMREYGTACISLKKQCFHYIYCHVLVSPTHKIERNYITANQEYPNIVWSISILCEYINFAQRLLSRPIMKHLSGCSAYSAALAELSIWKWDYGDPSSYFASYRS